MSFVQNPIIGRTTGQAGGMVFSTLFGKNVMRSRPASYRDKKSTAQVALRSLFAMAVSLVSSIKFYVVSFFESAPANMTCYSKVISQLRPAFSMLGNSVAFNPNGITLGNGSIPPAAGLIFSNPSMGVVRFDFDTNNLLSGQSLSDSMQMLIISLDGKHAAMITDPGTRNNGKFMATIPADMVALSTDFYVSDPIFIKSDGTTRTPITFGHHVVNCV